jgi:uncharacterized membrane protein YcfT
MTLFSIAAVLLFVRLILFIALHLVRSDYNIVNHAVSDYAVGRTRWLSTAMTWATALAWAALAVGVATSLPHWSDAGAVIVCLVILALIFAILPFVPTTVEGQALTLIGRLHYVAAIAWFAISYAIMGNFVRLIQHDDMGAIASTLNVVQWVALVSLVALVVALFIKPLRSRVFGISERVFILAVNIFYLVTAVGLAAH